MPSWDHLQIIKPDGKIDFYALNPEKGVTRIGRDGDNDLVIDDPKVQPFHAVFDYRQKPARLELLGQDSTSEAIAPEKLHNFGTVELGGHILVFLEGDISTIYSEKPVGAASKVLDLPQPSSLLTIPFLDQTDEAILAHLSARAWTVEVDQAAAVEVTVKNEGSEPAQFEVSLVGLDESWFRIPNSHLELGPDEEQQLEVIIKTPRRPGSRSGIHHFAVKVTSPQYPQRYCQQRATLTIKPYYDFILGGISPKQETLSWFKSTAHFELSMSNTGNTISRYQLAGEDLDTAYEFEFQLPDEAANLAGEVELSLLPDEVVSIPIRITSAAGLMVSFSQKQNHFTITTTTPGGGLMPRSVSGCVIHKPLLGSGTLAVLSMLLVSFGIYALMSIINLNVADPAAYSFEAADVVDVSAFVQSALPHQEDSEHTPQNNQPLTYQEMFKNAGSEYDLDWRVLEALAYRESRMDYLAVGAASDLGLMQVVPSTWNEWAPRVEVHDPFDPYSNILVGAAYLAFVRDFCVSVGRPEPHWMLVGYNWGPSRLNQFFNEGGTWDQVPLMQRQYALTILEMASARAVNPTVFEGFYADLALEP